MMKLNSTHYVIIGAVVILGAVAASTLFLPKQNDTATTTASSSPDALATCISASGAKFYGAFWCPHCKEQKALFGNAVSLLPYIECSTADEKGQTKVCIDAGITGYPTWEFANGQRVSGVQTLATLAQKTNCPLPTK